MRKFSKASAAKLATCHPDLQRLFNEVIKEKDCIIICGARTLADQQAAYIGGFSKKDGILKKSTHQVSKEKPLSTAVDVLPYPLIWSDTEGHKIFAEYVLKVAKALNIKVQWGGHWKTFYDAPHYQL